VQVARERLLQRALRLGVFTVAYNLAEGAVAITAGSLAGSGALVAFGLDSGIESLSGGILIWRLLVEQRDPARAEAVERRALRLIGMTFFVLAAYVAGDAGWSLIEAEEPDSSVVGIVLTAVSLVVMPVLARRKRVVGEAMGSRAVVADSAETRAHQGCSLVFGHGAKRESPH
jgi:divalent metal cation (Fe/Co/Zn/Cd) transporter